MNDHHNSKPYPPGPGSGYAGSGRGGVGPGGGPGVPPPGSVASGPAHTSITLNTHPTPGARVTEINLNLGYFKTLPGILKCVQLVGSGCLTAQSLYSLTPATLDVVGDNNYLLRCDVNKSK